MLAHDKYQLTAWTPVRVLWLVIGIVAIALGAIGVVLPLLPTTPFVLLAAFAFTKAWPAAARRLENHRVFGPIIADWRAHQAIAPRYKVIAHLMMLAALGLSIIADVPAGILAVQVVCLLCASAFILSRPSHATQPKKPDHSSDQAGNRPCPKTGASGDPT